MFKNGKASISKIGPWQNHGELSAIPSGDDPQRSKSGESLGFLSGFARANHLQSGYDIHSLPWTDPPFFIGEP